MSWFGFDRLRARHLSKTTASGSDSEVADLSDCEVEIQTFVSSEPANGNSTVEVTTTDLDKQVTDPDKPVIEDDVTETDGEAKDEETLIPSEEIDEDGVVTEYEVALKHLGFGFFHVFLLVINGIALTSDAVEVLAISFVLPILNQPNEFNIADWQSGLLSSVIFLGMLIGSYFWGSLADVVGRRAALMYSLLISGVFGLLSAFAPWFWLFIVLRLFSGFGVGGSLPVIFPYASELIRNKYRGSYLGAQGLFWTFGRFLCGAMAWMIIPWDSVRIPLGTYTFHSWRLFIAMSALPSILGVVLYLLLPESPRYLLEVGKNKEAMKALRLVYRINHWGRKKVEFPIKSVLLAGVMPKKGGQMKERFARLTNNVIEVMTRAGQLFKRKLLRRTLLLMLIMFCLSFGSYGVVLWYPSFVGELTQRIDKEKFESFCSDNVSNTTTSALEEYCGCSDTLFQDSILTGDVFQTWRVEEAVFSNVIFKDLELKNLSFANVVFEQCLFDNVSLSHVTFNNITWEKVTMEMVNLNSTIFCSVGFTNDIAVVGELSMTNVSINGYQNLSAENVNTTHFTALLDSANLSYPDKGTTCVSSTNVKCNKPHDYQVYRDSFIVSCALIPGNIVAIIAVYFFRRNLWLAFTLFASAISVFLLYVVHSEAFVVVVLCLFSAITTPAWGDTSLIMAEVYPTELRSSATGVHLLMARLGAIIGTNIFGEFIHVNPSVPIFLVAAVLSVGAVAAIPLPTTTRKTLLK